MHDLIEQSAQKREEKSKWELTPPRRPRQEDIAAAQPKPNLEEQYNLFDR